MTTTIPAIRAAEQFAARFPRLPPQGEQDDVAALLRAVTAERDERVRQITINVFIRAKEHEDHTH